MKKSTLTKLFSVLLCITLLLVSCSDANKLSGEPVTEDTTPYTITELLKSNYKDNALSFEKAEPLMLGERANTYISGSLPLYIFKDSQTDHLGNVTTAINVFNAKENKSVLSVSYTTSPTESIYVHDKYVERTEAVIYEDLIVTVTITAEPLTEEMREEIRKNYSALLENDGYSEYVDEYLTAVEISDYIYTATYDVYDALGTKLTSFTEGDLTEIPEIESLQRIIRKAESDGYYRNFVIGDKYVSVKRVNGEAVEVCDVMGEPIHSFDFVMGDYGYYLSALSTLTGSRCLIQIYNVKTGALLYEHTVRPVGVGFSNYYETDFQASVLNNGNIYVAVSTLLDEDEADFMYMVEDEKLNFKSYIIDVTDGSIINCINDTYLITEVVSKAQLDLIAELEDEEHIYSDKLLNIGVAYKVENKTIREPMLVSLDSNLNVLTSINLRELAYEADFDNQGLSAVSFLKSGDMLIKLVDNAPAGYAVVTMSGKIRSYVPKNAEIFGDTIAIYTDDGMYKSYTALYDLDLKCLFEFDKEGYQQVYNVGENFVAVYNGADMDDFENIEEYYDMTRIQLITKENGQYVAYDKLNLEEIVKVEKSFIITYDDGKYNLYNDKLEKLVASEYMIYTIVNDECVLVYTVVDGETVYYTLKAAEIPNDDGNNGEGVEK